MYKLNKEVLMKDYNLQSASKYLSQGAVLLDIRTRKEFCQGHLCNAWNIETPLPPLSKYSEQRLYEKLARKLVVFDKHVPIIIYCKKGIRARIAKEMLQRQGFKNVLILGGVNIEPLKSIMEGKAKAPENIKFWILK